MTKIGTILHTKASSSDPNVVRGIVYSDNYYIWQNSTNSWVPYYNSITSLTGTFYGDGSGLTGIVASASVDWTNVSATGTFKGDGSGLTGIVAGAGNYLPLSGNANVSGDVNFVNNLLLSGFRVWTNDMNKSINAGSRSSNFSHLGGGIIQILGASAHLYHSTDNSGYIYEHLGLLPASSLTAQLVNETSNYLVAGWDIASQSTTAFVTTDVNLITESNIVPMATLYKHGDEVYQLSWDKLCFGLPNRLHRRLVKTERFVRESGLLLSTTPSSLAFQCTSGVVWYGAMDKSLSAIESSTMSADLFYHVTGNWVESSVTGYNNTQYDDGVDLQTLSHNRYAVNWIYRSVSNSDIHFVLGSGNYKLDQAQKSQPPSSLPPVISQFCILIGRIIVEKNSLNPIMIDSAFNVLFSPGGTRDHGDLIGLLDDDHPQYALTSSLSSYALTSSLSAYSLTSHVHPQYALTSSLSSYALTSSLSSYALTSSLSAYSLTSHVHNYLPLSGGTVTGLTYFTSGLSANTLSANSATGFADESTIEYTAGGKLKVKSVPYTSIVYPFDLASLTFTITTSPVFRFVDAESTTGTGTYTSTSVSWTLGTNYQVSGNGVNALSASFYKTSYNYTTDTQEKAYTSAITPPALSNSFADLKITCSGSDQDNILNVGATYGDLWFKTICKAGDSTHYDWLAANNPESMVAEIKYFVLPTYALTSSTVISMTTAQIRSQGNPTLAAYYRGSYSTYTPTYVQPLTNVYIWFVVPQSHCGVGATIYQNTALGWYSIATTYVGALAVGVSPHIFNYYVFRSTNLQSPADSYNQSYRLNW